MLSYLKEKDRNGRKNIIKNLDHVTFRDQEYLVLEPLHRSLKEVLDEHKGKGLNESFYA